MTEKVNIGFSDIGGIYIGNVIQTDLHTHHAITIAVSFTDAFDFYSGDTQISCRGLITQANTVRKFGNPSGGDIAFIHIEPFSPQGLKLTNKAESYTQLTVIQSEKIVEILRRWLSDQRNDEGLTAEVIEAISSEIGFTSNIMLDSRIEASIEHIRNSEHITLQQIAEYSHLSAYRFSHLFRQQMGMSFRKFVLYSKLVKSLKALVIHRHNLTSSAYIGGFADQPHFNRTYLNAFGVRPNQSIR